MNSETVTTSTNLHRLRPDVVEALGWGSGDKVLALRSSFQLIPYGKGNQARPMPTGTWTAQMTPFYFCTFSLFLVFFSLDFSLACWFWF